MGKVKLVEFTLPLSLTQYLLLMWFDSNSSSSSNNSNCNSSSDNSNSSKSTCSFYESFLLKLNDINITIDDWTLIDGSSTKTVKRRCISSFHPSKLSFPGLPSHAESKKTQIINVDNDIHCARVDESTSFIGIPYSDYFCVNTEYLIVENKDHSECDISVSLEIVFHKSTWLQMTIESNTKAELLDVYNTYIKLAKDYIVAHKNTSAISSVTISSSSSSIVTHGHGLLDDVIIKSILTLSNDDGDDYHQRGNIEGDDDDDGILYDNDDVFYDCDEGDDIEASKSWSKQQLSHKLASFNDAANFILTRSNSNTGSSSSSSSSNNMYKSPYDRTDSGPSSPTSVRDFSINIVETVFVIVEYLAWKVNHFHMKDMKSLFNVTAVEVRTRLLYSFIPGCQSSIIRNPDMYGGLLAVLVLPQVLIISLGVSRHGCNQSSLLGNAVVMCLFLWIGMSVLYRIISFAIAPYLSFKHCLCLTGYSFCCWNLAIVIYVPLETYLHFLHVPEQLPLILFGLPVAIAQGSVFCCNHNIGGSTVSNNSKGKNHSTGIGSWCSKQRILLLIPKMVSFMLIAATHYQFLWYLVRVFLPGKRELCLLTSMVNPTTAMRYAEIISQKDTLNYAKNIITGNG